MPPACVWSDEDRADGRCAQTARCTQETGRDRSHYGMYRFCGVCEEKSAEQKIKQEGFCVVFVPLGWRRLSDRGTFGFGNAEMAGIDLG